MEVLRLENVSFDYRQIEGEPLHAVKEVSLSVRKGEFLVLAGANGSGKSTLAKMMNGLVLPTRGKVYVYGTDTADKTKTFDIRRRVGMVFQNPDNQMIATIVEDDIAFGPENLGVPREEIIRRVDWALKAVGMEARRKDTPFKMSGGQKQRIAIAGILAIRPDILILDEATSMLDPKGRREVTEVITRLNKEEGITVIHITHHMDEAVGADRIAVMHEGRIVMQGTPAEVFASPLLTTEYRLALPVASEIAAGLKKEGFDMPEVLTPAQLTEAICRLL